MSTNFNRGSEWRRWDLHVHSPVSDGFIGDWDQFKTQLQNADCEVIGINDYFSVEGYKKIKYEIENGELDISNRVIFPVVEMRMRDILQNRHTGQSGNNINFHIIFNNQIDIEIVENFIKSLEVDGTQIANKYFDKNYLKNTPKVYFEDIIGKLNENTDFKDNFIVWLPYNEYGGIDSIDPESDDWIKRDFIKKTHILGSATESCINFFSKWISPKKTDGTTKFSQAQFEEWFDVKKPCIKGSDSHSHDYNIGKLRNQYSEPIEKYCWIKADATFEGLKQIISEPESRVFIGQRAPSQPTNLINSITFNVPDNVKINVEKNAKNDVEETFCLAGINETYYLSTFLNCFIGGRGTGKSTILNFLGLHSSDSKSSKAFWDKINPSFDPLNKDIFYFDGVETFEFVGQSEVESFATDKEAFTNAIYERANLLCESQLKKYEKELTEKLKKIDGFIPLIENLLGLKIEKEEKQKVKKNLENTIKTTKSPEYSQIVTDIQNKSTDKQSLEMWRNKIDELRESLTNLQKKYEVKDLSSIKGIEEDSNKSEESEERITNKYEESLLKVVDKINDAIDLLKKENFEDLIRQESNLQDEIKAKENELSNLLEGAGLSDENVLQVKRSPQELIIVKEELQKIEKKISDLEDDLAKYDEILESAQIVKINYENTINDSIKPLVDILDEQASENEKKDIKNIGLRYFFDLEQAWKDIADNFYYHFSEQYGDGERSDLLKEYICTNRNIFDDTQEKIKKILDEEEKDPGYIKFLREVFSIDLNYKVYRIIKDNHLNDVTKYKRIQVLYDNKDIENASFGQRCTAVVVILLLFGNYPLIIDEPEAHLDSSLIANYLVPLIKKNKNKRQIIFATHNANFVINGDSEKIFILKNETGITQFIETTIEDLDNRTELLKLEGGKEAFKKRGEKLNIKN